MDPLTAAIVGALAAGATAAVKDVASQAVKDAYAGLRTLIVDRYKQSLTAIVGVEEKPDSEPRKQVLAEDLSESGAVADPEVQKRAAALDEALQALPEAAKATLAVHLRGIEVGRSILLEKLAGEGPVKVDVQGAKAGEDFVIRDVTAGRPDAR